MLQRMVTGLPNGFLRNLKWQYVANLGAGVLGGFYMLLLGRVLGVSEFGIYSLCASFAALISNLFDMRLQDATIRFVSHCSAHKPNESEATIKALILLDIVVKAVAFAVLTTLLGWAGRHLVKTQDAGLLLVLAGISLFVSKVGNGPAVGILRLTDKFDVHAQLQLVDWGTKIVVTLLISVITPLTVGLALAVMIIVGAAVNLAVVLLARKSWQAKYGRYSTPAAWNVPANWRQIRHFVLSSSGISVFDSVLTEMDTAIVGWFLTIETVGIYRMAKLFTLLLWRAADPMQFVIMPELSKFLVDGDTQGLKALLKRVTWLLIPAALVIYVSAALCVPSIVKLFLGAEFAPIAAVFPLMASWVLICMPIVWVHALAAAAGRPDLTLVAVIIGNALAAFLLVLGTWFFGLYGAVIGWSAGLTAGWMTNLLLVWKSQLNGKA